MAKEQLSLWLRTAVILAGIVFAGGGYAMKVKAMDKDLVRNERSIEKVDIKVETVKVEVQRLEVNQERDIALKESLLSTMIRLESKMDTFGIEQIKMKGDIIETKSQVNTLIRD